MSSQRRALSPVIATVILAGVVLTIGGAVWSYSLGATTVIANGYVDDTLNLLNEITERYSVEHVFYDDSNNILTIWIFNYGEVDIIVDVYVNVEELGEKSVKNTPILSGDYEPVAFIFDPGLVSDDLVAIKVYSRRQNIVYGTYSIP